ncbi:MAG: hypothetical protein AAF432_11785, partial [Planctomycetota bacterium]
LTDIVADTNATVVDVKDILTTECDILAPCALGGVINSTIARELRCDILCGGANNILDDPDEDAAMLKNLDCLYVPDFVSNAGGVIWLAGLYLDMSETELLQKVADIESTTAEVLRIAGHANSTHAAAVELAHVRIAAGAKEQVHAG